MALIIDDIDVALPRPLMHTIAVIEPDVDGVAEGALRPDSAGMRFIPGAFGHLGYAGPRPIRGHGPHHYRFHVFALDVSIPDHVTTAGALWDRMAGHALARGVLTGTYQRTTSSACRADVRTIDRTLRQRLIEVGFLPKLLS